MNQNVNLATAASIILISLCLISMIFWARSESLYVGGPDQMQFDVEGNAYIHVTDKIYKLSPQLGLLDEFDLPDLGIHDLVGDFAFFSNGDMLVRLGKYQPGFFESILRYFRVTETRQPVAKHDNEGLYRCKLDIRECVPFGSNNIDFNSAFHLSIDTRTDTVYISDTSRHKLRKFNEQGIELAVRHRGYKFPNQILLQDGKLLIADTNHHAIQVAETNNDKFGEITETHSTRNAALGKDIWTYSFAKVADNWWVNNMSAAMSNGAVAIYDNHWQYLKTIELPSDADPIDIAVFDDRVLITDLDNIRIYQLNYQGQPVDDALPGHIHVKLSQLQKNRTHYKNLSYLAISLFIIFLAGGFIVAIRQARNAQEPLPEISSEKIHVNINDPNINWIPVNRKKMRLVKFATLFPLLLLPIIPFVFMAADKISNTMPIVAMIFVIAIIPFLTFNIFKIGLGTLGDILIIKKSDREFAAAKGNNIFYSDTHILIDQVYIPFSHQQLLFETEPVVKEVMPLLRDATYIQSGQMINMMLKRQKPWRIVAMFVFALMFIAILFGDMYR